jgi:hypothetical protein
MYLNTCYDKMEKYCTVSLHLYLIAENPEQLLHTDYGYTSALPAGNIVWESSYVILLLFKVLCFQFSFSIFLLDPLHKILLWHSLVEYNRL